MEGVLSLCPTDDSLENLSCHLKVARIECSGLWQLFAFLRGWGAMVHADSHPSLLGREIVSLQ